MPDFSKRYNQNEIETEYDAQRAAMAGRVLPVRHKSSRPSINTSKFETEYQNFIKKLKEQKAQEQEQAQEVVVETVEEPVVEAPKPKKKKSKVVVLNDVITETSEEAEAAITEKVEEQPELPTFDLD